MEALGEGAFTEKGLADAFQHAVGRPVPEYVKPTEGIYKVWNEKDYGGKNRAFYRARFSIPPEKEIVLANEIEKVWRDKYGASPDVEVTRGLVEKTYSRGVRTINQGTISLVLNELFAHCKTLEFTVSLDPVSGEIWLTSYRGTEDSPAERPKPTGSN